MPLYRVATFVTVEAEDVMNAAQKAFILHEEMTPEEFFVSQEEEKGDPLNKQTVMRIDLTQEDKEEARALQRQGKMFRTETLKEG